MDLVCALPVKPFGAAKQRLASVLPAEARRRLGKELCARTVETLRSAGLVPVVVAADREVSEWADSQHLEVLLDLDGDLNRAAAMVTAAAEKRSLPWLICHADLPLVEPEDLTSPMVAVSTGGWVISPSSDGGTSLFGGEGPFRFAYGSGSFQRHLAMISHLHPLVTVRLGLAVDLDEPSDLVASRQHRRGRWLETYLDTLATS